MFIRSAGSPRRRSHRSAFLASARVLLSATGLAASALLTTGHAAAQSPADPSPSAPSPSAPTRHWEIRVASGAFVPAGDHRLVLKGSKVTAVQVSWLLRPRVALSGAFAWAGSRDLGMADTPRLDVFTSDVGIEVRTGDRVGSGPWGLSVFAGMGAGIRSYNHRGLDMDATHNPVGYGSVGGEVGLRRVGLRIEMRSYLTRFRPLVGSGSSEIRADVAVMAALRFNRRYASGN